MNLIEHNFPKQPKTGLQMFGGLWDKTIGISIITFPIYLIGFLYVMGWAAGLYPIDTFAWNLIIFIMLVLAAIPVSIIILIFRR